MLATALIVFTIVASLGLYLATHVLRGQFAPWQVSLTHALLGATGLILLLAAFILHGSSRPLLLSFLLFLITAIGGFFLATFHLRQRIAPKLVVVIHAGIGLGAFLSLLRLLL